MIDKGDTNTWTQAESDTWKINLPEPSGWVCYLWGSLPDKSPHSVWYPPKGQVPNAFVRLMMKVCFACTWVKEKK